MDEKELVIQIPGKYARTQEEILIYLYENADPSERHSTLSILSALSSDSADRGLSDTQADLEELYRKKFIQISRRVGTGKCTYEGIKLTKKGEREALEVKNRPIRTLVLEFVPKREEPRPPLVPDFED